MKKTTILNLILLCALFCSAAVKAQEVSTNSWYVGNTEAGEWIQFKKVWLSAGDYRFTTNAVAQSEGQTVHLELNGEALANGVSVPYNADNKLELVHLGYTSLPTGYYDIKLVFETGGVNCDMIFIKKNGDTSSQVLDTDTEFKINRTDGAHIFAIGGPINSSSQLAKGGEKDDSGSWKDRDGKLYTRSQMLDWYKQSIYEYAVNFSDDELDTYVSEQVEAKIDVIFSHGRGDADFVNDIEDRAFRHSAGNYSCRALSKLCAAINRNVYAKDNMKIAYFVDNAVFKYVFNLDHPNETFKYDDPRTAESIWNHMVKPFFENIPRDMLFEMEPGFVPVQLWTGNVDIDYGGVPQGQRKIKEFLVDISDRCFNEFGFRPAWILSKDFFDNDSRLKDPANATNPPYIKGIQAWFAWNAGITNNIIKTETSPVDGTKFGFAFNGGRLPLSDVWKNDWNPLTGTGTKTEANKKDSHISSLDNNRNPIIRPFFDLHYQMNDLEWIVLESWSDWAEGSTWYRSNDPEYAFPNQHMAMIREFADRESESIVLEAEGCDEFYDKSTGNKGGTYRVNWYSEMDKDVWDANMDVDLDIYRPLHKLGPIVAQGKPFSVIPTKISAWEKDIWAMRSGNISAHQIDGKPAKNWKTVTDPKNLVGGLTIKDFSLGGRYVWAISTVGYIYHAELPSGGWAENTFSAQKNITTDATGFRITNPTVVTLSMKDAWVMNANGDVYTRNLSATKNWRLLPAAPEKLVSIEADNQSLWGITEEGNLVRMNTESQSTWVMVPNPHNLTKISAGASEVWGVNANNDVYRINASGDGEWSFVANGYSSVEVGMEYVWLCDPAGNFFNLRIDGFEDLTAFPTINEPVGIATPVLAVRDVRVYPTPFVDELHVDILMDKATELNISIYDLNGRLLSAQKVQAQQGSNYISIDDVAALNQGVYLLSITSDEYSKAFKVVKTN